MDASPIRLLVLDADSREVAAFERGLEGAGLNAGVCHADSRDSFQKALGSYAPDVVIAGNGITGFSPEEALALVRAANADLPAIVVRRADADCTPLMAEGAWDCVRVSALGGAASALAPSIRTAARMSGAVRASTERARPYLRQFENACDGIVIVDLDAGTVVDVNPAACELLGTTREALLGRDAATLGDAAWRDAARTLPAGETRWRGDVALRTAAGGTLTVDASARVYEAAGVHVAQWHLRDVSALRDAEAQVRLRERLLQRIIDSTPDAIAMLDTEGAVHWLSAAGRHALGVADANATAHWLQHWHVDDRAAARAALAEAAAGRFGRVSLRAAASGHVFDVVASHIPVDEGDDPRLLAVARDISSLREAQADLRSSEAHKRSILWSSPDAIVTVDTAGRISEFNPAAELLFGLPRDDALGRSFVSLLPADAAAMFAQYREAYLATRVPRLLGRRLRVDVARADGERVPVEATIARLAGTEPPAFAGFLRNLSLEVALERQAACQARRQELVAALGRQALREPDLDRLFDAALEALCRGLDLRHACLWQRLEDGSHLLRAQHGWPAGRHAVPAQDGAAPEVLCATLMAQAGLGGAQEVPVSGAHRRFGVLGAYARTTAAFDERSEDFLHSVANLLESAVERRAAEDAVGYLAQFDALTGLANRNLVRDRIGQRLSQAERGDRMLGVMVLGIDGFREVNEQHGHDAGDQVLREVALRLTRCVRPGDVLGRLGGDEFALAWDEFRNVDEAGVMGQRVADAIAAPVSVGESLLQLSISRGVSVFPGDGVDADTLLSNADTALQRAKGDGRGLQVFYGHESNARVRRRIELETELRRALREDELRLCFQPQVALASGRTVGVEALLRWRHPVRGWLSPDEFIGVAEQSGLILDLGRWVLHAACRTARAWQRAGHDGLQVAVNVSPAELRQGNLGAEVRRALQATGLPPACLELEITENLAMDGSEHFLEELARLKAEGVSIAIDDFGTGYSSLSYLKRFPVDKVKIDRSFVADISHAGADEPVVRAVIALSHELGFQVIAEGVETRDQLDFLRRHGCDVAQGFLYGQPLGLLNLRRWLRHTRGASVPFADA